jgi:hypothetical protein
MRTLLPALAVMAIALCTGAAIADENQLFPTPRGTRTAITLQASTADEVVGAYGNPDYVGPSQGFATQLETPTGESAATGRPMKVYGEQPRSVLLQGPNAPRPERIDRTVYFMYVRGPGKMIFGFDPATGVVVTLMATGDSLAGASSGKGVTLGDTMAMVTRAYGFPERQEVTGSGLVAYYPEVNLTFTFSGLRVTGITLGKQVGVSTEPQIKRLPVIQAPSYGPGYAPGTTTRPTSPYGTGTVSPLPPGARPAYVPSGPQLPPLVVPPPVM